MERGCCGKAFHSGMQTGLDALGREGSRKASAGQLNVERSRNMLTLGALWVPTRAAKRVHPAKADGYRPQWGARSTRVFAGSRWLRGAGFGAAKR